MSVCECCDFGLKHFGGGAHVNNDGATAASVAAAVDPSELACNDDIATAADGVIAVSSIDCFFCFHLFVESADCADG